MAAKIPNFQHCMTLMRRDNSNHQEEGFHLLQAHAAHFVEELMTEFRAETDYGLKCWLLELLGHARSEKAFELFKEQLSVGNLSYRDWAIVGLQKLNTKESRALLTERGFNLR
jgi:hypothetical protein